jgi:uncharacterized membrane protein YdfJ with MMPL/SSD domain
MKKFSMWYETGRAIVTLPFYVLGMGVIVLVPLIIYLLIARSLN